MKMSDFFESPVSPAQLDVYVANGNPEITYDDIENAAAYAINNHDRLTSENARLREALKECINELKAFQSDHEDFGSEEFIAEQEDLLAELEKGYE